MATGSVTTVYLHVIEDVISKARAEFQAENVDESVLAELQSLWELKMVEAGAILASDIPPAAARSAPAPAPTPVQDLNIPYTGTEEFTPTAELLFSSPFSTPTPGPPETPVDRRRGVDVNVAYEESHEEEENGPAPVTKDFFTVGKRKRDDMSSNLYPGTYVPQHDGATDNYEDEVAQEDYNEAGEEEPAATEAPAAQGADAAEGSEASEPPLNEEDDDEDDLDDIDQAEDELNTSNLVLAQFEKVSRSKNKWKCVLKDGIMHLNNRDILFSKANGEFEF